MKIAVCQINTTVGDFKGNQKKIVDGMRWAKAREAQLAVFPELTVPGYPPRDLLDRPAFIEACAQTEIEIARQTEEELACIFGNVTQNLAPTGRGLYNTAVFAQAGSVRSRQHKTLLPLYDVFDEARHFDQANAYQTVRFQNKNIGLSLCEDIWSSFEFSGRKLYSADPVAKIKEAGAELLINISASPFHVGKRKIRHQLLETTAKRYSLPIVYCNLIGGNDELVFDGRSVVVDAQGLPVAEGKAFQEDFFVVDSEHLVVQDLPATASDCEDIFSALALGLRDYATKCGFKKALLGLSGGIDSALVAKIAADAFGAENVLGVLMPSEYSSEGSLTDALELAKRLQIKTRTLPIAKTYQSFLQDLTMGQAASISLTQENIQPRIRGTLLMALSNETGALLLSTGNKSELSCGYCTLYGDMAGGFAVIADVPKMTVYELCRWLNRQTEIIPKNILDKSPSAELKPGQKDEDSLPPYSVLDPILKHYIEDHLSVEQIAAKGFSAETVEKVIRLVDRNEYKRRQAPPGIKLTGKAFGMGRRFPMAWKYP